MLEYHQLYRAGRPGFWWLGVACIPFAFLWMVLGSVLVAVPFVAGIALAGGDIGRLFDIEDPTPLTLAYLNTSLALSIGFVFLLVWALHGLRPGWVTSVAPRMRWSWLAVCFALSLVALLATLLVSSLVPAEEVAAVSTEVNPVTRVMVEFALVVLVLTPLQAAGEEYLFRGYLTQSLGSLFPQGVLIWLGRVVAVVVPALFFAMMHGFAQDLPIFVDRFAFGLVAGVLVIGTGGLEAPIAMHVLNNFFAFGLALAFTDMGSALNPTDGTWWSLPGTLTQSLVYLGLALLAARVMGLQRRAELAPTG